MSNQPSAIETKIGMLTLDQAWPLLPIKAAERQPMALQRLIARGSIPAEKVGGPGGELRVPLSGLKSYLADGAKSRQVRAALGLPEETVEPIWPIAGSWFDVRQWAHHVDEWLRALTAAVGRAAEIQIAEARKTVSARNIDGTEYPEIPGTDLKGDFNVTLSPEIKAVIARPVPEAGGVFKLKDASAFKNTAEIYLAQRLQVWTYDATRKLGESDPNGIREFGVPMFYSSPETYKQLAEAGLAQLQQMPAVGIPSYIPSDKGPIRRWAVLLDSEIMKLAGTNAPRLACLAF